MKKNYFIYMVLIIISFVLIPMEAFGNDITLEGYFDYDANNPFWEKDLQRKYTVPYCEYVNSNNQIQAGIYLKFKVKDSSKIDVDFGYTETRYSTKFDIWTVVNLKDGKLQNDYGVAGSLTTALTLNNHSNAMHIDVNSSTLVCPPKASFGKINKKNILCFHYGNASWCDNDDGEFTATTTYNLKNGESYPFDVYNYATKEVYTHINSSEFLVNLEANDYDIVTTLKQHIEKDINTKYGFDNKFRTNEGETNFIVNSTFIRPNEEFLRFLKRLSTEASIPKQKLEQICNDYLQAYDPEAVSYLYLGVVNNDDEEITRHPMNPELDTQNYCSRIDKVEAGEGPGYGSGGLEEDEEEQPEPEESTYHDEFSTTCQDFASTIRMGGYILFIMKILLPIIIIIKSTLNAYSVISNGAPEELKKQAQKLLTMLIASAVIFFAPTIINVIFNVINGYNDKMPEDSKICSACVFDPFGDTCNNSIKEVTTDAE